MKKILVLLLLMVSFQFIHAKSVVGSYTLSYFGKSFTVQAAGLKNNKFSIYIEVKGEKSEDAFINIDSKELDKFKKSLLAMKDKFEDWSGTASENNISKMNKLMDVKFPPVTIHWETPSRIHLSVKNNLDPVFSVLDDGTHAVVIARTAKSAFNEFITETIYWVFSKPSEIDELISLLDEEKIISVIKEEKELIDLFN